MKKILSLIVALILLVPFAVKADDKIKVYIFHGDGCPHCEEAFEFFEELEKDEPGLFELIKFEVWNNEDNHNLMQKVAEKFNEEASGVPYIIIGEKTFHGYTEAIGEDIANTINEYHDNGGFVDMLEGMYDSSSVTSENSNNYDNIVIISFVAIVAIVTALIVLARKKM